MSDHPTPMYTDDRLADLVARVTALEALVAGLGRIPRDTRTDAERQGVTGPVVHSVTREPQP